MKEKKKDAKFTLGGMGAIGSIGAAIAGPTGALVGGVIGGTAGWKIDTKMKERHRRYRKERVEE